MALYDLIIKAKINMAMARDPLIGMSAIYVRSVHHGRVVLTGDVDGMDKVRAAEVVARQVPGVNEVESRIAVHAHGATHTPEELAQRFLLKLDDEWNRISNHTALLQADYIRWSLWMLAKFHVPDCLNCPDVRKLEVDTVEKGLANVAQKTHVPAALLALELLRQAETTAETLHPDALHHASILAVSPPAHSEMPGDNP